MSRQPIESIVARVRRLTLPPWLLLAIGIPVSLLLFDYMREAVDNLARLRFERQASDAKGVIEGRIHSYAEILYALRALFATHGSVTRVQFHNFVAGLDLKGRYPGFDSVNYAAYVRDEDARRFEEEVRSDTSLHPAGYPNFVIKPAGERAEYFVVVYLEPMAGYEFAFGRDLAASTGVSDPGAVAATLRSARDTGKLAASGLPIRIKTASEEYVGLAMRLPVYRTGIGLTSVEDRRATYLGSVGAGFNVQKLMRGVLDEEMGHMGFRLYDAGAVGDIALAPAQDRLLFDSRRDRRGAGAGEPGEPEVYAHVLPIEVAGRMWQVHFSAPKSAILEPMDAALPWVVLSCGIAASLLLAGLFYSMASSRSRAVAIANEITRDLAENRALLNDAQKLSHVGCCQYNPGDGRVIWSEELYRIHGVNASTFVPTYASAMMLVHPDDRANWKDALDAALVSGEAFTSEFRIVRPDGSVRSLRSLGEVIHDTQGRPQRMLWSVLDITEQKRTEDALRGSADQLTALSRRLVDVQEAERRQLSRELHDRVGQNLTALSINLDILRTSLAGESTSEHRARLADSAALLESTVDSIENVMSELRPPMLDDYGLLSALHWYAKDFSKRTGIEVDVRGDEAAERPAPETEITLFRIAQEALTNVAKHANASRVQVEFEHLDGHCVLTVTDNGIGIGGARPADSRARRGLGMVTMRERTQAVGGRFDVRNVPGNGTQIAIEVPTHVDTHTHR